MIIAVGCAAGLLALGLLLTSCSWQRSIIFHPRPLAPGRAEALPRRPGVRELTVTAADGTRLRGWLVGMQVAAASQPAVIYFGGNAEEVSARVEQQAAFGGRVLALVPYRGYGANAGVPGAAELLADALAVYDAVAAQPGIDTGHIAVMGRSLGTGIAARVAADRPVERVVLVSPYDRFSAVAQDHMWFLPVRLILRHNIDADDDARRATASLLAVIGLADATIAPERSRALLAAWRGPTRVLELPGCGHNDMDDFPDYRAALHDFLALPPVADRPAHPSAAVRTEHPQ
ncbi:MAG TPA: alpha/beta hydrolase [bacterium]|nr:alpha/beta hydrolase [bacterium]